MYISLCCWAWEYCGQCFYRSSPVERYCFTHIIVIFNRYIPRMGEIFKMDHLVCRLWTCLSIFLCFSIERTLQFNLETRIPVIKNGPADSFFGFSVAEHVRTTGRVSAPYPNSLWVCDVTSVWCYLMLFILSTNCIKFSNLGSWPLSIWLNFLILK